MDGRSSFLLRVEELCRVVREVPELVFAGHPALRMVAEQVPLEEGRAIGARLVRVLERYRALTGGGRGIAAPQIGEAKAVFVLFEQDVFRVYINPVIVEKSAETNFFREVCLSTLPFAVEVERPEWIVMEWMDELGMPHRERAEGMRARVLQHEEAHLHGKLIVDGAESGAIGMIDADLTGQVLWKREDVRRECAH